MVFRWAGFSPAFSLLMPTFAFPSPPAPLPGRLPRRMECSPTACALRRRPAASAACFMPAYYPCPGTRPVSCYALFECMAASKPTSWLSLRPDRVISNLACTWGPWPAVWILLLSAADVSTRGLAPDRWHAGIRSLSGLGRRRSPRILSVALPPATLVEAAPKGISGSTSYLSA